MLRRPPAGTRIIPAPDDQGGRLEFAEVGVPFGRNARRCCRSWRAGRTEFPCCRGDPCPTAHAARRRADQRRIGLAFQVLPSSGRQLEQLPQPRFGLRRALIPDAQHDILDATRNPFLVGVGVLDDECAAPASVGGSPAGIRPGRRNPAYRAHSVEAERIDETLHHVCEVVEACSRIRTASVGRCCRIPDSPVRSGDSDPPAAASDPGTYATRSEIRAAAGSWGRSECRPPGRRFRHRRRLRSCNGSAGVPDTCF